MSQRHAFWSFMARLIGRTKGAIKRERDWRARTFDAIHLKILRIAGLTAGVGLISAPTFLPMLRRVLFFLLIATAAFAADWPQFRGPTGLGYTEERDLPLTWNSKIGENIVWRAPLPKSDNAYSSPIVVGQRVLVTCVTNQPVTHTVLCFAASDGKPLWQASIEPGPLILKDLRGGYGAPTPCSDRSRVFVVFGSAVIAALEMDGKVAWR